jgi:hypothetical protein
MYRRPLKPKPVGLPKLSVRAALRNDLSGASIQDSDLKVIDEAIVWKKFVSVMGKGG